MNYKPLKGLTTWCIALSIAAFAFMVVMTIIDVIGLLIVADWVDPNAPVNAPWEGGLVIAMLAAGGVSSLIGLAAGILFLIWFAQANGNVPALGVMGKRVSSGWSVGWWFIPFANLVMPFRALKETYLGSKPGVSEVEVKQDPTPGVVGWWWGLWLLNNLLINIETQMASSGDTEVAEAAVYVGVLTTALMGVGLWLYVRWTLDIVRWQQVKHDSGGAGLYACTNCGYDLRGTRGPMCPECGAEVPAGHRAQMERQGESASPEPWQA